MSAARRAALAETARGLIGEPSRVDRLARRLGGKARHGLALADLEAAPHWLRRSAAARADLGRRAALATMAPALAASIDGRWLRELSEVAGPEALDWAIEQAPCAPAGAPLAAAELDAVGAAVLAVSLPPRLASWLGPRAPVDPAHAAAALQLAIA